MKNVLFLLASVIIFATSSWASTFVNGGFEDGATTGWTLGAGSWATTGYVWPINPDNYLPSGSNYDMSYYRGAVVTPGADPIVGAALNRVYSGNYAYRANDQYDSYDYSLGVIKQSVSNYDGDHIYFAWAAVLQASHGATDSDNFTIQLIDDTTHAIVYSKQYSSYTAPGVFTNAGNGWYYTPWQVESIAVTQGDSFTLELLAADCAWGGHAGYAYLDGFGVAPPVPTVPEPSTVALLGLGLAGIAMARKRMRK